METLNHIKKLRNVASLLKSCEKNDVSGSGLSALLAIPLKRINQYEFWLENMFECTSTTDPDYQVREREKE